VRQRLDLKTIAIQFLPVTSAQRIPTMMEGKADLECGSTTNNAERRKSVAFTVPHYITGTRYMVRANSGIETLRDFDGKKLVDFWKYPND
jgi:glutamate/aspartate transport system substrate-binding protein